MLEIFNHLSNIPQTNSGNGTIAFIPGTAIRFYSILMAVSILLVVVCSWWKMHKRNIPTITLEGSILVIIPIGLIGARIWYVLNHIPDMDSFYRVIAIWDGGIAIEGGVTFGFIAGFTIFYRASKKYHISMWTYLDCIIPNILIGQAIGRWGNFFNQEVLGADVHHPFSWLPNFINAYLHYPDEGLFVYRQPLFLYESFCSIIGFIVLTFVIPKIGFWVSKKPWKVEANQYQPIWINNPIIWKTMWYQPWKIVTRFFANQKWKRQTWIQAFYEFEPKAANIKNTIGKPLKLKPIKPNEKWLTKVKLTLQNFFHRLTYKFDQNAAPLNNSYNPHQYRFTAVGVSAACYFIFYGIIRAILEPFRETRDLMKIGVVPTSVVVSIIWVIIGIGLLYFAQFTAKQKFRQKGWFYERQY